MRCAVSDQGVRLDDVIVFLYGPNDHVDGRIDAKSAQLGPRRLGPGRTPG